MKLPEFITFTGADDATDFQAMEALARDYPVEFGILFSPDRTGQARYPSAAWVNRLCEFSAPRVDMRLAAHLCGGYSRELLDSGTIEALASFFFDADFLRCQVNTAKAELPLATIRQWCLGNGMSPIAQSRDPARFPGRSDVAWLYDCSGGCGKAPAQGWPIEFGTRLVGFAGGLNPSNAAAAVDVLSTRASRYWIDMESGVRDADDRFDLELCRMVCEAVYGAPGAAA